MPHKISKTLADTGIQDVSDATNHIAVHAPMTCGQVKPNFAP